MPNRSRCISSFVVWVAAVTAHFEEVEWSLVICDAVIEGNKDVGVCEWVDAEWRGVAVGGSGTISHAYEGVCVYDKRHSMIIGQGLYA